MNETEQRIFDIIKTDVCGQCNAGWDGDCPKHRSRCEASYERQAREIYLRVVLPLEKP